MKGCIGKGRSIFGKVIRREYNCKRLELVCFIQNVTSWSPLIIVVTYFANINVLRRSIGGDVFHDLREVYVEACGAFLTSLFFGHRTTGVLQPAGSWAKLMVESKVNELIFQAALAALALVWLSDWVLERWQRRRAFHGSHWRSNRHLHNFLRHVWNCLWSGRRHIMIFPKFHKVGFLRRFHVAQGNKVADLSPAHWATKLTLGPPQNKENNLFVGLGFLVEINMKWNTLFVFQKMVKYHLAWNERLTLWASCIFN